MTKEQYLALAAERYDELRALNKIDNFYDYEKEFEKIFNELGRAVLEQNISEVPADRRKKNTHKIRTCRNKRYASIQPRNEWLPDKSFIARDDGLCRADGML
jgi:hypothetical protein